MQRDCEKLTKLLSDLKINCSDFQSALVQREIDIAKIKIKDIDLIIHEYSNIDSYQKFEDLLRKCRVLGERDRLLPTKKIINWFDNKSFKNVIDPTKPQKEVLSVIYENTNEMVFGADLGHGDRSYYNLLEQNDFFATILVYKDNFHHRDRCHYKIISINKFSNNQNIIANYLDQKSIYSVLCEGGLDKLMEAGNHKK